jgi:Na+/melibiose symporter-like transporter
VRRAAVVLILSVGLDIIFGLLFALAEHVSLWNGLYFATTTASTVGYGDITPHGWAPHLIAVAMMLTVIPLFSAVFSLLTTTLTTKHVDRRHDELKQHIDIKHADLRQHVIEVHSGGPGSGTGIHSEPGSG